MQWEKQAALLVPTNFQELGETRKPMTKRLMQDIEDIINELKDRQDPYFILALAKKLPGTNIITIKILKGINRRPPMFIGTLCFSVHNSSGKLILEWAIPGEFEGMPLESEGEQVPETIASYNALEQEVKLKIDSLSQFGSASQ